MRRRFFLSTALVAATAVAVVACQRARRRDARPPGRPRYGSSKAP